MEIMGSGGRFSLTPWTKRRMEPDKPDDPRVQPEEAEAPPEGADISEVEISQASERGAVLAAVMREQGQKAKQEEATLRLVMYFQAQKIEHYRLDTGRVPLELDDAGPVFRGMEYIRLTDRDYRILGRTFRVILSYSSVEPIDAFVGDGANILELGVLD